MSHDELLARHRAVMPGWQALYYEEPIALVRGEGRHVWDSEGNRFLDFFGGILTTLSGHNVPEIVDAIRAQAGRILHTSTLYMNEQTIELAETIARLSPIEDAKVFFVSSGTEANDAALLLATSFRRSNQVLALRNSYHGRSFSSVAITGNRSWSPTSVSGLSVAYVHGPYMYRSPFKHLSESDYVRACVDDLRDVIVTQTAGDVACMIAEPIQGVGGFATPPDGLYAAMKEVLDEYGIPFVADEVQTGWGRTGEHFWGIEAHGVTPDLVTFAKGVGNGMALGGVIGRAEVMDSLAANSISTFGGNPLATAGALANIRYLLDNDLQANAAKVGDHMFSRLRDAAAGLPVVGDVRGKGLMIGIELVDAAGDPYMEAGKSVMEACKVGGLIIGRGGLHGNVLRVAPPLSVTIEEADEALDVLTGALRSV
jgi:4-aminobutyrate aminotransferase